MVSVAGVYHTRTIQVLREKKNDDDSNYDVDKSFVVPFSPTSSSSSCSCSFFQPSRFTSYGILDLFIILSIDQIIPYPSFRAIINHRNLQNLIIIQPSERLTRISPSSSSASPASCRPIQQRHHHRLLDQPHQRLPLQPRQVSRLLRRLLWCMITRPR